MNQISRLFIMLFVLFVAGSVFAPSASAQRYRHRRHYHHHHHPRHYHR